MERLFPLFLVFSGLAVQPSGYALAGEQDVALMNRTGYQIGQVYDSRSGGRASWDTSEAARAVTE